MATPHQAPGTHLPQALQLFFPLEQWGCCDLAPCDTNGHWEPKLPSWKTAIRRALWKGLPGEAALFCTGPTMEIEQVPK